MPSLPVFFPGVIVRIIEKIGTETVESEPQHQVVEEWEKVGEGGERGAG